MILNWLIDIVEMSIELRTLSPGVKLYELIS